MHHRLLTLLALAAMVTVTAYGSDAATERSTVPDNLSARRGSTSSTTAPHFAATTSNTPGTLQGFVGAHADVHDIECARVAKQWKASGKVTNDTTQAVRYRIYVSFLDGDTTVGITQTDLANVAPERTSRWKATSNAAGPGLRCVLRVERAAA